MKRTQTDFSKHELTVKSQEGLLIHHLKIPDTIARNIKFINTNDILAVTGDYGNWIFCREFHPSAEGYVSDQYWIEKLRICSCQEPMEYDAEATAEAIQEQLDDPDADLDEEEKLYYSDCLSVVDDELEYTYTAYREMPGNMIAEDVIFYKKNRDWIDVVFDGFEEICRRLKSDNA